MEKDPILMETKHIIESTTNGNFHFDRLDWTTQVWLAKLCDTIDDRLEELNERIKELEK